MTSLFDDDDSMFGEESVREYYARKERQYTYTSVPDPSPRLNSSMSPRRPHAVSEPPSTLRYLQALLRVRLRKARALVYPFFRLSYVPAISVFVMLFLCFAGYTNDVHSSIPSTVSNSIQQFGDVLNDLAIKYRSGLQNASDGLEQSALKEELEQRIIENRRISEQIEEGVRKIARLQDGLEAWQGRMRATEERIKALESETGEMKNVLAVEVKEVADKLHEMREEMKTYASSSASSESSFPKEAVVTHDPQPIDVEEDTDDRNLASIVYGAQIIDAQTSHSAASHWPLGYVVRDRMVNVLISDRAMIEPGACFPVTGSQATVGIRLAMPGRIRSFEYVHVYWRQKDGIPATAPKDLVFFGCTDADAKACGAVAQCVYSLDTTKPRVGVEGWRERVVVECDVEERYRDVVYHSVKMNVASNYGGPYTCLYLVRVNGNEAQEGARDEWEKPVTL